jgi:Zn-dependent peptidase ImmA (M78 family)
MKDTQIKICGINYDIRFKPGEAMGGLIGSANFNTQEISINTDHSPQTQKIAILHEILHIISDSYNLKWDEESVKFSTHALLALFIDNPALINDLMWHDANVGE